MSEKPFIVVNGSSYLFRAYHAMPDFTNDDGMPTGAIYGVINMMRRLLDEYSPSRVAVVFDAKGKTFRNDIYPEYKANRPPMPDDLRAQIMPLHEILEAMGFPLLVVSGVEADDVIGTLARMATEAQLETIISTGDKDMAQLVNEHISLVNTMTDTFMDVQGVVDKFGVRPEQIIDYLALMGDKVDNVPGIPKVGPKTAVKWLDAYHSMDGIIQNANEIKGKVGESLREHIPHLPLSKELVTIVCDVPLEVSLDELVMRDPDNTTLAEKFNQLGFRTWYREVTAASQGKDIPDTTPPLDYQCVLTRDAFNSWLDKLSTGGLFAFDVETTSLDYMDADLVGVSIAVNEREAAYIPLQHQYENCPSQLELKTVLEALKPHLESMPPRIIGQHFKYDMNILARYGMNIQAVAQDTMLLSYILNSVASRHDMDTLANKHLGIKTTSFEDVAGKGVKQVTFDKVELEDAAHYAAEDADVTLRLYNVLHEALQKIPSLYKVYAEIELPLVPVLHRMESTGVLLDAKRLQEQSHELSQSMVSLQKKAFEVAGEEFNLASPKQIQAILFEKLELPVRKKTPKGAPSTSEEVLQELSLEYELPSLILQYRSMAKLKSTYTDKLPQQINSTTGRVHTSYHQAVTATGRLSSSDPNLQNIPVRTDEGRRIRQAFIAPPGFKLLAADYSQIELRIMADLSGDKGLISAFSEGRDVHRSTASEVFGVAEDEVTTDQRRNAKAINFGLIYGMSAFGLARQLDIERGEAQRYMDEYFARYPAVLEYMERTRITAAETGYVETLAGRRLYLPDIKSSNHMRRQYAERTAINAPMQGTAADIIKKAMIKCDQRFKDQEQDIRLIMQVHDELVFEVRESFMDTAISHIREDMESAMQLSVPLVVDIGTGNNWDEAH